MAHFAKLDNDNVVTQVIVIDNLMLLDENGKESEAVGQAFIASLGFEGTWLQCSYNTIRGIHKLGGTPFRGTYPSTGMIYDPIKDEFVLQ